MSYTAGIIGAGGIAGLGQPGIHAESLGADSKPTATHAGGYAAVDDIELCAIADPNQDSVEQFGERWSIPPDRQYLSHEQMLAAEDFDVISICSPTNLHRKHVIDAVETDDPPAVLWCEKPIASSLADADKMVAACQSAGIELLVNHSYRFMEKIVQLRKLVAKEDIIGDVKSIHAQLSMELLRNSTHLFDTVAYLFDTEPELASGHITDSHELDLFGATGRIDDRGGGGYVLMDDGTFLTIDTTTPRQMSTFLFHILGSEGKLYLNFDDSEWRYWDHDGTGHVAATLRGMDGEWTWDQDYPRAFPNAAAHVSELLDRTATNRSPGEAAVRALEPIIGMYISHFTGSHISIPIDDPLRSVTVSSW